MGAHRLAFMNEQKSKCEGLYVCAYRSFSVRELVQMCVHVHKFVHTCIPMQMRLACSCMSVFMHMYIVVIWCLDRFSDLFKGMFV